MKTILYLNSCIYILVLHINKTQIFNIHVIHIHLYFIFSGIFHSLLLFFIVIIFLPNEFYLDFLLLQAYWIKVFSVFVLNIQPILKDIFAERVILDWQLFSFSTLTILLHWHLASIVFIKKSANILILFSLKVMLLISLHACKIIFFSVLFS